MIEIKKSYVKLDTLNTTLLLKVDYYHECYGLGFKEPHSGLAIVYYGSKISSCDNYDIYGANPLKVDAFGGANDDYMKGRMTYSSTGMHNNRDNLIVLKNADGTNVNRFDVLDVKVEKGGVEFKDFPYAKGGYETLIVTLYDEVVKVKLLQKYTVFEDVDVIAVCQEVINESDTDIYIDRIMSLQLDLDGSDYSVYSYDGTWIGERNRHVTKLNAGRFEIDSKLGSSSSTHNPFITVKGNGRLDGYYGFNLIYSGNHKEIVEVSPYGSTRVLVGMNDYLLNWKVESNSDFTTPQAVMVYGKCFDNVTENMHKFVLEHIIDANFKNYERPILYNHWEGTGIDYDEERLLKLAKIAADVGVELFVMDDGWFGNRFDDKRALGDWWVNKNKFPNGLRHLSDSIKNLGMKFGIWVEPEMINGDSDIFRTHPEFAMAIPNREPLLRRSQMVIDMTNPDVIDYLYDNLSKMIEDAKPDYIKWDYNRAFSDMYSSVGVPAGEYTHKFILGTYKLISTLKEKYPDILFESCSSGGGRYDLGMFFYMPQTWCSDNSNTFDRVHIQCGTLDAYPQSTVGAHVTRDECRFSKLSSIEDRFNIACVGAFGYEFDFSVFSERELKMMKEQIKYYKKHKKLLQFGKYICIDNIFDDEMHYSYIIVSEDKSEAMLTLSKCSWKTNNTPSLWRAKGLIPNALYSVEMRPQFNVKEEDTFKFTASGDMLMNGGLNFGFIEDNSDNNEYSGGIHSRTYYIKKI